MCNIIIKGIYRTLPVYEQYLIFSNLSFISIGSWVYSPLYIGQFFFEFAVEKHRKIYSIKKNYLSNNYYISIFYLQICYL